MTAPNPIDVFVDIVGACNLRCPSCPVGNMPPNINAKHIMEPATFEKIVAKMASECKVSKIHLYNWGEPFLHPQLPKMIEIAKKLDAPCYLSSNFNAVKNLEEVLLKNPYCLRISLSGYNQEIYGQTHRGGNIETVKRNLDELALILRRTRSSTRVHVFYHRYRHNLDDENLMKKYARQLGFGFHPVWALLMPAEKVVAFAEPENRGLSLTDQDRNLIQSLALPLSEALTACRRHCTQPCGLPSGQLVLNSSGQVQLCCVVYDASQFTIAPYLEVSFAEIQRRRKNHPFCAQCIKHGIHVYETFGTFDMDRIAMRNIDRRYARSWNLRWEITKKLVFHHLIPNALRQRAYDLYCRIRKY